MTERRSDMMVRSLHESAEKFDYFIMAVLSGLIAYLAKEMPAGNLSSVSFDLYLLSLLLLLIAMFLGLVRIEQFLQIKAGNVAREQGTELQQQMSELNRMWKSEIAAKQIEDILGKLENPYPPPSKEYSAAAGCPTKAIGGGTGFF